MRVVQLLAARRAARLDQAGQGLAEYAMILALIAMVCVAALTLLGSDILGTLDFIGKTIAGSRP